MPRYFTNCERDRPGVTLVGTCDDPSYWCAGCADDDHTAHVGVFIDIHGADHACCCERHDA